MNRRPIGLANISENLLVVCNDGSVWQSPLDDSGWSEIEPIPGTAAAGAVTHVRFPGRGYEAGSMRSPDWDAGPPEEETS